MNGPTVWLVTGCSSGLGEQFVKSIILRGDKVIATARQCERIQHLNRLGAETLQLDVTSPPDRLVEIVKNAIGIFGHIDVIIHNAGYTLAPTAVEDLAPEDLHTLYQTNVFGVVNLTQAILPHFRERRSGYVVLIGSSASQTPRAAGGAYSSSKAAIESLIGSMALEVRPLGIKTLILQPGSFRTEAYKPQRMTAASSMHYQELVGATKSHILQRHGRQRGDPQKLVNIALDIVKEGCAVGRDVPLKLVIGPDALNTAWNVIEQQTRYLEEWKNVIASTDLK